MIYSWVLAVGYAAAAACNTAVAVWYTAAAACYAAAAACTAAGAVWNTAVAASRAAEAMCDVTAGGCFAIAFKHCEGTLLHIE